jgi:8-oxo-dGTP pyrophosphatase MutT (NUDIX family)
VSTTAVVAEILIVGLEAEAWLAVLVLVVFGRGWVDADTLARFGPVLLLVVVAAAYALGVIVDRGADSLFKRLEQTAFGTWLNDRFGKGSAEWQLPGRVREMRFAILAKGGGVATFLDYQRSRIRVVRGTALNLLCGTVVVVWYLARYAEPVQAVYAGLLMLALLAATVVASERIHHAWLSRLCDAYVMLSEVVERPVQAVVAAVTVAPGADGEPVFLIVRTKGGRKFTFPKGHVEDDDATEVAAVARELAEEGGVRGEVASEPFTSYRLPVTRPDRTGFDDVRAYLVRLTEPEDPRPREQRRKPKWRPPAEALEKLKKGRDDDTAKEHERVLRLALDRLAAERARPG